MKISDFPGCTLKNKAKNLEDSALASLSALGVEVEELERWNCCGAVYSLADDDLIHQVAPVRDLIRARDAGADRLMTLCSQCYNVLARANRLMREDEEKRKTINLFMDEEADYHGEVEVVHFLDLLADQVGWEAVRAQVKVPLEGLRVAPYYGCTLVRPTEVAVGGGEGVPRVLQDLIAAVGATPVRFSAAEQCCGAYELLINPVEGMKRAGEVLSSAGESQADALVLSCPLCEYNLGRKQDAIRAELPDVPEVPVFYFTQLLAVALGLEADVARFDLNMASARKLLQDRNFVQAPAAQGE